MTAAKQDRSMQPQGPETAETFLMDRNYALEAVRVTEAAALAASRQVGRGNKEAADQDTVDAMRHALSVLTIQGRVVIGEGERDEAPMLYIGEEVGQGTGPKVDIALDPLEGTTITAKGGQNALSIIAMAEEGGFLNAPDVYMEKMAVGPGISANSIDLDAPVTDTLYNIARDKGCRVDDLLVCILDRDRHNDMISRVRQAGARVILIPDGDVSAVIATAESLSGPDVYMGIGGAPEGVLAAAALQCVGGHMLGRLNFSKDKEIERAERWGITDRNRIYTTDELARPDNLMFAATGVTDGAMLEGVHRTPGGATTHSLVMRSKTGTIRRITAEHNFERKTDLAAVRGDT